MIRACGRGLLGAMPLLVAAAAPAVVSAHGFGERYDLPVPLSLYLWGAGITVAVSFVLLGFFVRRSGPTLDYPHFNLLRTPLRLLSHPAVLAVVRTVSAGLFVLILLAGFIGSGNMERNIEPTVVWILWWVGLAYVCALLGNFWALVNPWRIFFSWADALCRRLGGRDLSLHLRYPRWLGAWPAVLGLWTFAWLELVWPDNAVPHRLATAIAGYSGITWLGMFLFGRELWLARGEAFSITFGLLSRFAVTEARVTNRSLCTTCSVPGCDAEMNCVNCYACFERADPSARQWNLRPPAVGLLTVSGPHASVMVFVLLLLSTVTYDGFKETPLWGAMALKLYYLLSGTGGSVWETIQTVGLMTFPVVFLAVYLIACVFVMLASGKPRPIGKIARLFVFSLVPIAIGYHLAHYMSYLLVQGQRIIPLLSDPFGWGWNLFGTANYEVDIAVVGAWFIWYTAVVTIVVGHVIAVYLAHMGALRAWSDRRAAIRSQYPMLVLMIFYTTASLWILAQPIVETVPR